MLFLRQSSIYRVPVMLGRGEIQWIYMINSVTHFSELVDITIIPWLLLLCEKITIILLS